MKKLLLLSTAIVTFATPADAGPLAALAAWVGSTLAAGGVGAFLLTTGLSMGINAIASALYKPEQEGGVNVKMQVEMGDDLPLSFVVGDYVASGKRKYIGSWGRNTRFITEVIEVSALPQGFEEVWINDEKGEPEPGKRAWIGGSNPDNDRSWTEGATVPAGSIDIGQPYRNMNDDGNRIVIKWKDGKQTAADPFLMAVFGDDPDYPWTDDMIGTGKSYAIVTTRFDSDTLTNYPSFLFKPAPLALYDWRKDSTNGGNGTQRWDNPATWLPTRNPAVIAYNIVRGIYYGTEWVFGGKNLPAWRLPVAEWTAAANACDETVTLAGGATEPWYRAGAEITVDQRAADILELIGKASNMKFAEVGGRLKPIVGLPGASVLSITDGDIIITEGQSFQPFYPISDTHNAISAVYPEPTEKWTNKDAPEYIDAEATEADGGDYRPVAMSYECAPYPRQVQRLMRAQMRDFRRMRRHSFHLPPGAYRLEPSLDMITWTSTRNGYINKKFIVEKVRKLPGMNVSLDVREVDNSDYDWTSNFERPITLTPPKNPLPFVQTVPGLGFEASSLQTAAGKPKQPTIRTWCDAGEAGVTNIHVQGRIAGTTEITLDQVFVYGAPYSWHVRNPIGGQSYEMKARLLSKKTPKTQWSPFYLVSVPSIKIDEDDLSQGIVDDINKMKQDAEDLQAIVDQNRQNLQDQLDAAELEVQGVINDLSQARLDLTNEVNARLNEAIALRGELQGVRDDLDDATALLNGQITDARSDFADDINTMRDNLLSSMGTAIQTGIDNYNTTVQGQFLAMAGQIDQLTAALTSADLLQNGDFSTGDLTSWVNTAGVTIATKAGNPNSLIAAAPRPFVAQMAPNSTLKQDTATFTLTANDRLRVRFGAATVNGNAANRRILLRTTYFDANGNQIGSPIDANFALTNNVWGVYTHEFDPPDNAVKATVEFYTASTALNTFVTAVEANTADRGLEAEVISIRGTLTTLDQSLATYKTEVNTRFNTTNASITSEANTRSTADSAISDRIDTIQSTVSNNTANITTQGTTITNLQGSLASLDTKISSVYGSVQLIRDPQFDEGLTYWLGNLGTAQSLLTRDVNNAWALRKNMPGRRAFTIGFDTPGPSVNRTTEAFDISVAETYDISFWAARNVVTGPSVRVFLIQLGADGQTITPNKFVDLKPPVANEWVQGVLTDLKPNPGAVKGRLQFYGLNDGTSGNVYITGLEVKRQDAADARSKAEIATLQQTIANDQQSLATYKTGVNTRFGQNETAINNETTARTTADSAMGSQISSLTTRVGASETAITSEITARSNADSALGGRIDTLTTRTGNAETKITNEITARTNADSAIGLRIDSITTRIGDAESTIEDIQLSFTNSESALATYKQGVNTRFGNNETNLTNEITARSNADSALGTRIDTVSAVANRSSTYRQNDAPTTGMKTGDIWWDTNDNNKAYRYSGTAWVLTEDPRIAQSVAAITSEATARANADSAAALRMDAMTTRIGDAEADITTANTARVNGDSALSGRIDTITTRMGTAEAAITTNNTARVNGDNALSGRIDAVVARVGTAEGKITTQAATLATQEASIADLSSYVTSTFGNTQLNRDPDFGDDRKYWGGTLGNIHPRNRNATWPFHSQMPGRKALAFAGTGANESITGPWFEASEAETYDFGLYVFSQPNGPRMRAYVQWANNAGSGLKTPAGSIVDLDINHSWRFYQRTSIKPPAGTVKGRVVVTQMTNVTGAGASDITAVTGLEVWRQTAASVKADAEIGRVDTAITNANAAIANTNTTTNARFGKFYAGGMFRVSSVANVGGSVSRIAISAATGEDDATQAAALWLEAQSNGQTRVVIEADRFVLSDVNGTGARRIPFLVENGVVYIHEASIRNLSLGGVKISPNAITSFEHALATAAMNTGSGMPQVCALALSKARADPIPIWYGVQANYSTTLSGVTLETTIQLLRNGVVVDESTFEAGRAGSAAARSQTFTYVDTWTGTGPVTYTIKARVEAWRKYMVMTSPGGSGGPAEYEERTALLGYGTAARRFIGVLNAFK